MDDSNQISINVKIGEQILPMSIKAEQEEDIRNSAKLAQGYYEHYKSNYQDSNELEILRMVILAISRKNISLLKTNDNVGFTAEISDIVESLREYLQEQ